MAFKVGQDPARVRLVRLTSKGKPGPCLHDEDARVDSINFVCAELIHVEVEQARDASKGQVRVRCYLRQAPGSSSSSAASNGGGEAKETKEMAVAETVSQCPFRVPIEELMQLPDIEANEADSLNDLKGRLLQLPELSRVPLPAFLRLSMLTNAMQPGRVLKEYKSSLKVNRVGHNSEVLVEVLNKEEELTSTTALLYLTRRTLLEIPKDSAQESKDDKEDKEEKQKSSKEDGGMEVVNSWSLPLVPMFINKSNVSDLSAIKARVQQAFPDMEMKDMVLAYYRMNEYSWKVLQDSSSKRKAKKKKKQQRQKFADLSQLIDHTIIAVRSRAHNPKTVTNWNDDWRTPYDIEMGKKLGTNKPAASNKRRDDGRALTIDVDEYESDDEDDDDEED